MVASKWSIIGFFHRNYIVDLNEIDPYGNVRIYCKMTWIQIFYRCLPMFSFPFVRNVFLLVQIIVSFGILRNFSLFRIPSSKQVLESVKELKTLQTWIERFWTLKFLWVVLKLRFYEHMNRFDWATSFACKVSEICRI